MCWWDQWRGLCSFVFIVSEGPNQSPLFMYFHSDRSNRKGQDRWHTSFYSFCMEAKCVTFADISLAKANHMAMLILKRIKKMHIYLIPG